MILSISNLKSVLFHPYTDRYADNEEDNHDNLFKGKDSMTKCENK